MFINTEPRRETEVLKRLRATTGVKEAHMLYGTYDVVAVVQKDTVERLNEIVHMGIKRIDGVQSATTMVIIEGKMSIRALSHKRGECRR